MFSNKTDFDMVECPYNNTHRMTRKRLQPHLIKCRVNYPDAELQKCPFNQAHMIPEPEFMLHVTNCSDRKLITQYKFGAPEADPEHNRIKHEPIECDDNWDDTEVVDYNPKIYAASANVLRKPDDTQPAQRKMFAKLERKRLGDEYSDDEEEDKNVVIKKTQIEKKGKGKKQTQQGSDESDDERPATPPPPNIINWNLEKESTDTLKQSKSKNRSRNGRKQKRRSSRSRSPQHEPISLSPAPDAEEEYDMDNDPYYNSNNVASSSHVSERNNRSRNDYSSVGYSTYNNVNRGNFSRRYDSNYYR